MRIAVFILLFSSLQQVAAAQAASAAQAGQPLNATVGFNESYNASAGWASEVDTDGGFGLGRSFSLHAGAPFYLLQSYSLQTATGTTSGTYSGIGDAYLAFGFTHKSEVLAYTGTLTGTAPSGSTKYGTSTGRATAGWNNRFSHDFGPIEPFAEAGFATGSAAMSAYQHTHGIKGEQRAYTTLGKQGDLRAGAGVPLGGKVDWETSFYDVLPVGNQKLFSKVVGAGTSNTITPGATSQKGTHGRQYELNHEIAGMAGVAADHGFTSGLDFNLVPHVEFEAEFSRSMHYALNTVSLTASYHFGGGQPKGK